MVGTSGSCGRRLQRRDAQRLDVAALDLRQHVHRLVDHVVELAGHQVIQRRSRALVGNLQNLDLSSCCSASGRPDGRPRQMPAMPYCTFFWFALT